MHVPELQAMRILRLQVMHASQGRPPTADVDVHGAPVDEGTCLAEVIEVAYEEATPLLLSNKGEPSFFLYIFMHAYILCWDDRPL